MQDFRTLKVWANGHALALGIYAATRAFPREERYGMVNQLRRASTSIPSNIAEGCGRGTRADFARFLRIAMGSASEVEYQLLLARDLAFLNDPTYESLSAACIEVKRMLSGLIAKLVRLSVVERTSDD